MRMNGVRLTIGIFGFWLGAATASDVPLAAPDAAMWRAAAQSALAVVAPDPDSILVLDASLPSEAGAALKALRKTLTQDQLPDRKEYVLPPGPYVWITLFAPQGDRFTFRSTAGVIQRNVIGACGQTTRLLLAHGNGGAWHIDGPIEGSVC
jgi:hypothetical protein